MPPQWRMMICTIIFAVILNSSKTEDIPKNEDIQNDPSFVDLCPPVANIGDRFKINAYGTKSPRFGGCATKLLNNQFGFWIGELKYGEAHCRPIGSNFEHYGMEYFIFDCKNAWYAKPEYGDLSQYVYATLQERAPQQLGHDVIKCSMYEQKEGIIMRLAISENNNCTGLKERLIRSPFLIKHAEWMDGFMFLDFSPHTDEIRRPKRSPERTTESDESISNRFKNGRWKLMDFGNRPNPFIETQKISVMKRDVPQCRFPDWAQGQWANLKINGGEARYENAFYDEEDNMDETDPVNQEGVNNDNVSETTTIKRFNRSLSHIVDDITPSWRSVSNEHTTTQRPTKSESITYDPRVDNKVIYKNKDISLDELQYPKETYGDNKRKRRSLFPKTCNGKVCSNRPSNIITDNVHHKILTTTPIPTTTPIQTTTLSNEQMAWANLRKVALRRTGGRLRRSTSPEEDKVEENDNSDIVHLSKVDWFKNIHTNLDKFRSQNIFNNTSTKTFNPLLSDEWYEAVIKHYSEKNRRRVSLPLVQHTFDNKLKKGSEQFETLSELNTQFEYDNNNNSYTRLNSNAPISSFTPPPISSKKLPTFYSSQEMFEQFYREFNSIPTHEDIPYRETEGELRYYNGFYYMNSDQVNKKTQCIWSEINKPSDIKKTVTSVNPTTISVEMNNQEQNVRQMNVDKESMNKVGSLYNDDKKTNQNRRFKRCVGNENETDRKKRCFSYNVSPEFSNTQLPTTTNTNSMTMSPLLQKQEELARPTFINVNVEKGEKPSVIQNDKTLNTIKNMFSRRQSMDSNEEISSRPSALKTEKNARKKRCFWGETTTPKIYTTTERKSPFEVVNGPRPFDTITKYNQENDPLFNDKNQFTQRPVPKETEKPTWNLDGPVSEARRRFRLKRDALDQHDEDDIQGDGVAEINAALERARHRDQRDKFMSWWDQLRIKALVEFQEWYRTSIKNMHGNYNPYSERISVKSAVEFMNVARAQGITYIDALLDWRAMVRKQVAWLATVQYMAYPGQIHPDMKVNDFDLTFKDIVFDFDPEYPEGNEMDPTAYRVQTLPGGYKLGPRMTRRQVWKCSDAARKSSDVETDNIQQNFDKLFKGHLNLDKKQPTFNTSVRRKRSVSQRDQQKRTKPKFTWSCSMSVDYDENQSQPTEIGAKFLTWGGRITQERAVITGVGSQNEKETLVDIGIDDSMTYGCLWIKPRGPNILEFSIIGTGLPTKNQDMASFAKELCNNNKGGYDSRIKNHEKIRPRRQWWITETRKNESEHVPFACPVSPGTVFYGVVPAPPQRSVASNPGTPGKSADGKPLKSHGQLCAKLVSSADDCVNGVAGPIDRMKYTVSECVDQDSMTARMNKLSKIELVFEGADREYAIENRRRNKRNEEVKQVTTTSSTTLSMPPSIDEGNRLPLVTIVNITHAHSQTNPSFTSSDSDVTAQTPLVTQTIVDNTSTITDADPSTTLLVTTLPSLQTISQQQHTTISGQHLSGSFSPNTTTSTTTTTTTITTSTPYYPMSESSSRNNDYSYRQQHWQQQPNYNSDYYYNHGRQQQFLTPLPPSGTTADYNKYYRQQQQQQWYQQPNNNYGSQGSYQQQPSNSGLRTDDYLHRRPNQFYQHQYNDGNNNQSITPFSTLHQNDGWNVHGERPLYVSSGGRVTDNNRDVPLHLWNTNTSGDNGGWTTAAQQHWWHQQQQYRQQQYNRGVGGILSLPPMPLPPLHTDQGAVVTMSSTTSPTRPSQQQQPQLQQPFQPQQAYRQQQPQLPYQTQQLYRSQPQQQQQHRLEKPPNHFNMPTPSNRASTYPIPTYHRLKSKSESRYYQEREYQCIGQWTEKRDMVNPYTGEKVVSYTYTYLKRVDPKGVNAAEYECFVGTTIPNDPGQNPETTSTLLLTEAGVDRCSRLADPFKSGMKLVGTKIIGENSCPGAPEPSQTVVSGGWYPLKPQQIPTSENNGGKWYASRPVPVQGSPSSATSLKNGVSLPKQQQQKTPATSLPENSGVVYSASTKTIVYYLTISMVVMVFNHILI